MTFDWDEFQKLSDEEKSAYLRRVTDEAFEAAKDEVIPPGAIGIEKSYLEEGLRVVGYEKPDGTVHYYDEDELREVAERAKRRVEQRKRAAEQEDRPAADED